MEKRARKYRRGTKKFAIYTGTGAGSGLFMVYDKKRTGRTSLWFDEHELKRLKRLKANKFNAECRKMIKWAAITTDKEDLSKRVFSFTVEDWRNQGAEEVKTTPTTNGTEE